MAGDPDVDMNQPLRALLGNTGAGQDKKDGKGQVKPGGQGGASSSKNLSKGRRVQRLTESSTNASTMVLVGPAGHPTPPSGAVRQNSKEGMGVGEQKRLAATSNEGQPLEQQQMWREIEMQEQQIRQLEHHA
ncbi:unnamed protein product, partial [Ectocarpus fasciculatus]